MNYIIFFFMFPLYKNVQTEPTQLIYLNLLHTFCFKTVTRTFYICIIQGICYFVQCICQIINVWIISLYTLCAMYAIVKTWQCVN